MTKKRFPLMTVLCVFLAFDCSGARGREDKVVREVEMEPIYFEAYELDGKLVIDDFDDADLFHRGTAKYEQGEYKAAYQMFLLLIKKFPSSQLVPMSYYNGGLSLEALKDYQKAITLYKLSLNATDKEKDVLDTLFRIEVCHEKIEQWKEAIGVLDEIMSNHPLTVIHQVEVFARKGNALQMTGDTDGAEKYFRKAMRFQNDPQNKYLLATDYFLAMSIFRLAEIFRSQSARIKFKLPLESMEKALEEKLDLFVKAQNYYLKALRVQNPYWATAAGYHLGLLYEGFYDDCVNAEIPSDLTKEEMKLYFDELHRKVKPVVERAVKIYQLNLQMSARLGESNEWVISSEDKLKRMQKILEKTTLEETIDELKSN